MAPLPLRAEFVWVFLSPVIVFGGLWLWDRRRRFLELHPELVLRHRARRALKRERAALRRAARAGDTAQFASRAVNAMRVACAPHYPAEPRALVCGDVLQLFDRADQAGSAGEVVRRFFGAANASRFAATGDEGHGLLDLRGDLERVLEKLAARL